MTVETFFGWVGVVGTTVTTVGALIAGVLYLLNKRHAAIGSFTAQLAREWTNEGNVSGSETLFITLRLELQDGDLYGNLSTNRYDRELEAHVDVGWRKAHLRVSELMGRDLMSVGVVVLRLTENGNRLDWKLVGKQGSKWLPETTVLWPYRLSVT